jgi:magnesium chelatase family protein
MYGQIATLAFVGIEARPVEVQVRISPDQQAFVIVGLPDKAVAESREPISTNSVGAGNEAGNISAKY